jgi:spermidine synthase
VRDDTHASPAGAGRARALLLAVFFLSGVSALVYQVAWQRLLTVHYGVGAISICLIVSVYMFGLGVGGLLGGMAAERVRRRIALYVAVELSIAAFGVLSPHLLSVLGLHTAGSDYVATLAWLAAFLAVPTILMGTTLPLVTKIYSPLARSFVATVSVLYAVNTLGAAFGSLIASYVIVSRWGLDTAVFVAAGTNAALAFSVLAFGRRLGSGSEAAVATPTEHAAPRARLRLAGAIVFASGFLAIGYEIVWFRVIGILVKDSPYAFSSVLSVYLAGLGLGSLAVLALRRRWPALEGPGVLFAMQWLIGLYVLASILVLYQGIESGVLAHLPRLSFLADLHPPAKVTPSVAAIVMALDIFWWPAAFFLVPTLLMGAGFPLVSALGMIEPGQEGRSVGRIYWYNIAGNVAGGVATGFVLLPLLKTERTLLAFAAAGLAMAAGASALGPRTVPRPARVVAVLVPLALALAFFPRTGDLYLALHVSPLDGPHQGLVEEGRDGVVVTFAQGDHVVHYINGASHGGRPGYAYHAETIEALSCAPRRADILVIGYGAGSIVEQVLAAPGVERVTIVEINAAAIANLRKLPVIEGMLSDPRVTVVIDDGRRHLLRSGARYDLILMDPLRTRTAYSNNLYSREMADLVKSRLHPGGVAMVWTDEFKVLPRTWATAFPHLRMYTFFLLASTEPLVRRAEDAAALLGRYSTEERQRLLPYQDAYRGDREWVLGETAGQPINRDWKPVTEYYLGRP